MRKCVKNKDEKFLGDRVPSQVVKYGRGAPLPPFRHIYIYYYLLFFFFVSTLLVAYALFATEALQIANINNSSAENGWIERSSHATRGIRLE